VKGKKEAWLLEIDLSYFKSNPIKRIFKTLKEFVEQNKKLSKEFKINDFAKKLPEELVETLDRLYLTELQLDLGDEDKFKREFKKTKYELEKIYLKEKLKSLVEKIRQAEKSKKTSKTEKLKLKFTQISQKLKDLV